MKQEAANNDQVTEFDSILAESINNTRLKEGTIIKGTIAVSYTHLTLPTILLV